MTLWNGNTGSTFRNDDKIVLLNRDLQKIMEEVDTPDSIGIECRFNTFNNSAIEPFNYIYKIEISFRKTYYSIKFPSLEKTIDKFYNEFLSKDQLDKILKEDAYLHKAYIEKRIPKND